MKATKGWLEIVDDFGERRYRVLKIENGCYYFAEKTLTEHKLRYNEREGRIEEHKSEAGGWDVYSAYIYQASFIKNE